MFLRSHTNLKGKKFRGTVGEPWNFESEAGPNRIKGRIIALSPESADREWLLCEVSPFKDENGRSVDRVVLGCRYWQTESLFDLLLAGEEVTVHVHIFYPTDSGILDESTARDYLDNPERSRFLIGLIQLTPRLGWTRSIRDLFRPS